MMWCGCFDTDPVPHGFSVVSFSSTIGVCSHPLSSAPFVVLQIKHKLSALSGLKSKLEEMQTYLNNVLDGKLPVNNQVHSISLEPGWHTFCPR